MNANTPSKEMLGDLRAHLTLCQDVLCVVEQEAQAVSVEGTDAPASTKAAKKDLLPRLAKSLDQLRRHRLAWQQLSPSERARHQEVASLLRQNQELIMKILMLDRENEQALLRRGLVPPRHLPSVNRQRPNFVADLYRRSQA